MAETTTVTQDFCVAERTRHAAWSMRSAPRRELPPNLKATAFWRCLHEPPAKGAHSSGATPARNAAGLSAAAGSSCTFSRLMACAPVFPKCNSGLPELARWSVSGGGLKEETHRQVRFRRWVGNFLLVR